MDIQEFKSNVFPLKNKLFHLAFNMLDNRDEAEDAVQETFIKLWNRRERLDEYRSIEALAVVTLRNHCLDVRKSKRFRVESLEDHKSILENRVEEERKDLAEEVARIKRLIDTLPEQQQTIIRMRDIDGYEFETMADVLGMNENAIRVNLSRARKKVRELMQKNQVYEYQGS
jgi:RNA polymerase sigma-70 factor, ECF subfamily